MSENKFIERLQGKGTEKSVVEIKNTATSTMFTNMPAGDSNGFNTYSDHRGNATVVANGTMNWKVDSLQTLTPANIVNGNGEDFTTSMATSGAGLWINAEYTFPSTGDPNHPVAMVFNPQTKWVLKVCGDNLLSPTSNTIDFTVLITFGSNNIISKTFTVAEQANKFCKEFVIDFAESNTNVIKAQGLSSMKLQLLCGTADASANIYGGMTVLTCLQRKVEAVAISSTFANVEEVLRDGILPSDYFNNQAYIAQVTDGDTAYAVFQRDGDEMLFVGWNQPIPDQTGNSGKFLTTDGSLMSWEQLTISNIDGLQDDLDDLQDQITTNKGTMDNHIANTSNPHQVTKAQVGLGNVDNTSDLDKPISTATQTALDTKATPADITTAVSTHNSSNTAHSNQFTPITSVIPSTATSSNKLTDQNFVNSSIATNTANFIGTFNSVADLENYSGTVTNNDYAFVVGTDSAGNTVYDRYKYTTSTTPASWIFEYELNNSSFTAAQWASINSGITSGDVALISTAVQPSDLATVATSGSYNDLSNKPTIPAAQVNSDWNANSGVAQILNKPTLATVATSGNYNDLSNKPTIPTTLAGLTGDVDISSPTNGQHLVYDGAKWKNTNSAATVSWGGIDGTLSDQTDLQNALDEKANVDMDNLTAKGANIANWSSNVSNCITYIPQDIKLEFNTTTKILTLKAGSKLYIPNGSGVFNEITINSDQTLTNTFSGQYNAIFVCWDSANNVMRQTPTVNSGASDPSTASNRIWYDTTANKIKYYENAGTTVTSDSLSLPICIMQNAGSGSGFTKIQQVFNGFGYIGSSTFVLPGVKGLSPNGRNADGTCNNIELNFTTPTVLTLDYSNETSILCFLTSAGIRGYGVRDYYEQDTEPVFSGTYATWFNIKENIMYLTSNGGTSWSKITDIWLGYMGKSANANFTSFSPKCSLSLLDYNSKPEIVAWGRQFVSTNTTIAQGGGGIAGSYNLGFKTIDTVRIGVFQASLRTTQAGYSSMAISTDVVTSPCLVAGTNNQFANDGTITIPFINSVTISFPTTNGGIGTGTKLVFKGYM